jgi:hypothetical protein
MEGVGRQNWARGRIPIFRKIRLYGKSAKSTHGHTKKKPTQPFFRDLAFFRLPRPARHRRGYPTATLQPPPYITYVDAGRIGYPMPASHTGRPTLPLTPFTVCYRLP